MSSKRVLNTFELVEFLDKGTCIYRALSVISSAKKRSVTWSDVNVLSNTINDVVCQSRASLVPMKYQKRKHFNWYSWMLMAGEERVEGKLEAVAGREATNPPDNKMQYDVLVSAYKLF